METELARMIIVAVVAGIFCGVAYLVGHKDGDTDKNRKD